LPFARAVLNGGAKVLQLRAKGQDKGDILPLAIDLAALCNSYDVPFIINDHVDLALAAGADGVHVGQHDLPVPVVRRLLGAEAIVGCSTNTVDEALQAVAGGATYIGVGAMFPTGSKSNTRPAGIERLREIRVAVSVPIVAIGGITPSNAAEVVAAGADCIAVIGAISQTADPSAAARLFFALF
jgi:thiamine-phosphate pyrophosphorylase